MARGIQRVPVPPPIDSDPTVRAIAKILLVSARYKTLPAEMRAQKRGLTALLEPWGVSEDAVGLALLLTHTKGGYARGTAHRPNARRAYGADGSGVVGEARDREVYMRSAYLANAAKRMQRGLDAGLDKREVLKSEQRHYLAHEKARRQRLEAAAQVQVSGKSYGVQDEDGSVWLGWYHNPFLDNDAECLAASGHNFDAAKGTVIGFPGSVHPGCGCYAGPMHIGAGTVDEALRKVVRIQKTKPQFKLKTGRRRRAVSLRETS